MVLPSLLITFVGFLAFMIPFDSDEKTGMGVTTLLSMTVFLMVIADSMPPNSDNVPFIAAYYFSTMLIISLIIVCTVISSNISRYGENEKPVPVLIQKIFFDKISKFFLMKIKYDQNLTLSVKEFFFDNKLKNKSKLLKAKSNIVYYLNNTCQNQTNKKQDSLPIDNLISSINKKQNRYIKYSNKMNTSLMGNETESIVNHHDLAKLVQLLKSTTDNSELKISIEEYKSEIINQWKQLARVIDNCFAFIFLTISFFLFTVTFLFFYVNIY